MARNPRVQQDPAEAALSAIEEALNMGAPEPDRAARGNKLPNVDEFGLDEGVKRGSTSSRANRERGEDRLVRRPPANDDRESVGQVLQALQRKPPKTPYFLAFSLGLAWFAGGVVVIAALINFQWNALISIETYRAAPGLAAMWVAAFLPPFFFMALASLIWRAQESSYVSRATSQVAIRLIQPETLASDTISSVSQAVRREVAAIGEGVDRALARASELEMAIHNEVAQLERSYSDNELKMRSIVEDLVTQREAINANAEKVRSSIVVAHEDLTLALGSVTGRISQEVSEAGYQVMRALGERGTELSTELGRAGDMIVDAMTDRGSNIIERMTVTADEVNRALASSSERVTEHLTERAAEITGKMTRTADVINETFALKTSEISDTLTSRATALNDTLIRTGSSLTMAFDEGAGIVTNSIREASNQMIEQIANSVSEVNGTLRSTGDALLTDLQTRGTNVTARLDEAATRIADIITTHGSELADRLSQTGSALHDTIVVQGGDMVHRLADTGQAIVSAIDEHLGEALTSDIGATVGRLQTAMDHQAVAVTNAVESRLGEWEQRGAAAAQQVEAAFETSLSSLGDRFSAAASGVQEALESRVEAVQVLAQDLVQKTENESKVLAERIERIDGGLQSSTHALSETLTRQTLELARILGEGGKEVALALDGKAEELSQSLAALTQTFEAAISNSTLSMAGNLENRSALIVDTFSNQAIELTARLDERSAMIAETLSNQVLELTARLDGRSAFIADTLAAKVEDINRTLGARAMEVANTLDSRVGRFEEIVTGRLTEVSESLQSHGYAIASGLATNTDHLIDRATQLNATIGHRSQELAELLDVKANVLMKSLEEGGNSLITGLGQRNADLVAALTEKRAEIADAMDASVDQLAAALETRADRAIVELGSTNDRVRVSVGSLLERMSSTNGALRDTLDESSKSLDMIEVALSDRLRDFHSTMVDMAGQAATATDRVNDQVASLRNISDSVLTDIGTLTGRLEEQGGSLSRVATVLDRTQAQVDRALDERRGVLEQLVATISARTDSMGQLLNAFGAMIDDSLTNAELKARQVSSLLSENATITAQSLSEQFDLIRSATSEERERTSQAMRAAYEQAVGEVSSLFGSALERFSDVTDQVRNMAAVVHRELEETRGELQRGLVEIPDQTTDHIVAMRRVVAEQIQALNDLSTIVNRAGRAADVPERLVEAIAQPRAASGGGMPTARTESYPADRHPFAPPSQQTAVPLPQASEARTVPQPESGETRQGKGWITDLLARASRDEAVVAAPPQAAAKAPPSLHTLADDIASLMNQDAVSDVWDRYRRGERNIFSRRLYTIQGQQTFEEIRRRYRQDKAFRESADRYIHSFEGVMAEADRDDTTGAMAKSILTSDKGKVYTMLAHAIGRLA